MPWSGRSLTACPGPDAVNDMPWSGHSLATCPDWDTVIRHTLVMTHFITCMVKIQFYDIVFYMHDRDTVLRHALAGMPFYDILGSGYSITTCPGCDAVLQHALIGMQFCDMS